jgi:hypothetical protein
VRGEWGQLRMGPHGRVKRQRLGALNSFEPLPMRPAPRLLAPQQAALLTAVLPLLLEL